MNEGLKLENINALFEKFELPKFNSSSVIYGCINPKFWKFALYQELAVLDIKNYLIYFDSNEIILIGLTVTGDFTYNFLQIPMTSISNMTFKKGWINSKFEFTTTENKRYPFKVPNFVLTAKWQKPNLANIITTYINQ
ncbi:MULTISPECIES: hypothetical protein [unclassified Gilliamella]|uniref:hypothetical protein n=1 Tax=unclassified Gilliamella TaxID=2685620 RepID=UPI00226AD57A|nr:MULTISPECIES: hypothetical protein [unclassified Gilliamella]MCX8588214.1 hypothetical protein [Gilliamella sp. B3801]MCX8593301.1 hypothetical protein [Gilliamella sp. B3804]